MEAPLTPLSPDPAEDTLKHLAPQFAPWRQSRTTPRGRLPPPRWAQAGALSQRFPLPRVAKQLGLTPQALKRRRESQAAVPTPLPAALHFVEVSAPAWRTPTAEVEVRVAIEPPLNARR